MLQLTYKDHGYLLLLKLDTVQGEQIFAYVWRFMNGQLSGSQCVGISIPHRGISKNKFYNSN